MLSTRQLLMSGVLLIGCLGASARAQNAERNENAVHYLERTISAHRERVRAVAFLPDGKLFVSAGDDNSAKLCDMATGKVIRAFEGHTKGIHSVAVAADGKTFATGSADHSIIVWDVASGKVLSHLTGHSGTVVALAFQANHRLSSIGGDGMRVWDLDTEKTITRGALMQPYRAAYSADGTRVAVLDVSGQSMLCDATTCKIVQAMPGTSDRLLCVGLSQDGNTLIYNAKGSWYRYDDKISTATRLGEKIATDAIAFSADGQHLVTASVDGVKYWTLDPLKREAQFSPAQNEEPHAVAISSDGHHVIAGFGGTDIVGIPNVGGFGVAVFDLDRRNGQVAARPIDGVISWKVIPLRIKAMGKPVELAKYFEEPRSIYLRIAQADKDWDVVWANTEVFIHREIGLLEPVAKLPQDDLRNVQWDGKYLWAYSARSGMHVYTKAGEPIAVAGTEENLPTGEWGLITPLSLGTGKMLVAGAGPLTDKRLPAGWISTLEVQPGSTKLKVTTLMNVRNGPFLAGLEEKPYPEHPLLAPRATMRYGDSELWIAYNQTQKTAMPIVRVDLKTLALKLYNMGSHGKPFGAWDSKGAFLPIWGYGDGTAMIGQDRKYCIATVGPDSPVDSPLKPIFEDTRKNDLYDIYPFNGKLYIPGRTWLRIDTQARTVTVLGSGLQFGGKWIRDNVSYGISAKLGLCAISAYDGAIYQFSDDPQHPFEHRATKLTDDD